jgi:hypothetical protein
MEDKNKDTNETTGGTPSEEKMGKPAKERAVKKAEPDPGYETGQWKGIPRFQCKFCAFDTLHEDVIKEHIYDRHTEKPISKPVTVPLYDRFNNQIKEV